MRIDPKPGRDPGDLEFRFPRAGLMLAVDFDRVGGDGRPWISAYLWDRRKNANPAQLAWTSERLTDCYLRAAGEGLEPALCFDRNAVALRPAEYEALRAALLPEGLVHNVPVGRAVRVPVTRGDGRVVSVTVPENDRTYGGEVEGCGGDADLDRTRC